MNYNPVKELSKDNYCTCICHREGHVVMHMFACCPLCYEEYLDKDGNLIEEKLVTAIKKLETIQSHG